MVELRSGVVEKGRGTWSNLVAEARASLASSGLFFDQRRSRTVNCWTVSSMEGGMWKKLIFWRQTPSGYMTLEDASRELAKVWPPRISEEVKPSFLPNHPREGPRPQSEPDFPSRARLGLAANESSVLRARVLRELLLNGALSAYVQEQSGRLSELPGGAWTDVPIVQLTESERLGPEQIEYRLSAKVLVPRTQVAVLLKLAADVTAQHYRNSRTYDQGGAPPKYDSELSLTEAFRILYESNPAPKTPAELRRRALDAYVQAGHPGGSPSEDWARPKISKLWKRLRSE
jgi:hypothetical protein